MFQFSDLQGKQETMLIPGIMQDVNCSNDVKEIVELLGKDDSVMFWSEGRWSLYSLVCKIIERWGTSDLYLSSWGLSEEPLRALHNLQQKGLLEKLYCLLDYRIKERQAKAFQLCEGISTKIGLMKSHAKVTVIETKSGEIFTIIGSMNWTRNNKNEAGIILKNMDIGHYCKGFMLNMINKNDG
jgi:hypothetical protein